MLQAWLKRAPGNEATTTPAAKKAKTDKPEEATATPASSLTEEQKARIDEKRKLAQDKLAKIKKEREALANKDGFGQAIQAESLEPGWRKILQPEFEKAYFKGLRSFLNKQSASNKIIFPPAQEVFSAFNHCTFENLKVVIIGQDPYHGPGQGHGLCFSVKRGVKVPPSLKNVYKEAKTDDIEFREPNHGCLTKWAEQGVLLLNAVLTVEQGVANAHKKRGWEIFTDAVIRHINREKKGVVFLLWGKPAQKKAAGITRSKHHVITSSHPSPLGATKTDEPFIGSKCFSRANEYLKAEGKECIEWQV
jgi:uracil-DNA glycosylase